MKFYNKILLIAFFTVFLTFSCSNKKEREKRHEVKSSHETIIEISLSDSLCIDSLLTGHIKYKEVPNPLPNKEIYKKYTFLYATISKNKINTFEELLKFPHDTFVPINESIIPIYKLKSQRKGNMFFQGFIVDQFLYKKDYDSVRIVNQDRKIIHPIRVY